MWSASKKKRIFFFRIRYNRFTLQSVRTCALRRDVYTGCFVFSVRRSTTPITIYEENVIDTHSFSRASPPCTQRIEIYYFLYTDDQLPLVRGGGEREPFPGRSNKQKKKNVYYKTRVGECSVVCTIIKYSSRVHGKRTHSNPIGFRRYILLLLSFIRYRIKKKKWLATIL